MTGPAAPPIRATVGLPPEETVRAFEARDDLRQTVRWSEMWHEDHARAFTVAKVAKLDLLQDIQASLADVIATGGTFEEWRRNIVPTLQKAGWWGTVQDRDLTGTDQAVEVGPRRLRTIYDTNLRISRAAGQWARIVRVAGQRPWLRYVAVMDRRTRPEHRLWHGTVLRWDDPWWDTHFPPCGWGCRCTVRQLSDRELAAKGYAPSSAPPGGGQRLFHPAGRSEPVAVPAGIDPGFAYNPGKASMRAVAEKVVRTLERVAASDMGAAHAVLDEFMAHDVFLETAKDPGAFIPVAILDDRMVQATGATSRVVVMSTYTYAKQRNLIPGIAGHPELTVGDYKLLPQLFAHPDVLVADRPQKPHEFALTGTIAGKLWRGALKVLRGETLLTSFRGANARDARRDARWRNLLDV